MMSSSYVNDSLQEDRLLFLRSKHASETLAETLNVFPKIFISAGQRLDMSHGNDEAVSWDESPSFGNRQIRMVAQGEQQPFVQLRIGPTEPAAVQFLLRST